MTALAQYTAITERFNAKLHNIEVTGPSYDLLCKYDDLLDTAQAIRGELANHGLKPRLRHQAARFGFVAKMLMPTSCAKYFTTLVNLKTDWPPNWVTKSRDAKTGEIVMVKSFIDLSAHIEGVMREVRETIEGVNA